MKPNKSKTTVPNNCKTIKLNKYEILRLNCRMRSNWWWWFSICSTDDKCGSTCDQTNNAHWLHMIQLLFLVDPMWPYQIHKIFHLDLHILELHKCSNWIFIFLEIHKICSYDPLNVPWGSTYDLNKNPSGTANNL